MRLSLLTQLLVLVVAVIVTILLLPVVEGLLHFLWTSALGFIRPRLCLIVERLLALFLGWLAIYAALRLMFGEHSGPLRAYLNLSSQVAGLVLAGITAFIRWSKRFLSAQGTDHAKRS